MSGSLPAWIERLLGIDTGSGEGTIWSLDHTWAWPSALTLLFVVFAVVFVVTIYLRENREASKRFRLFLAGIRLTLIGLALAMAAQYALSLQRTGLPYVAVLVDDSLSQTIVDQYDDTLRKQLDERILGAGFEGLSRCNLAKTLLLENDASLLKSIHENYKLRVYFLTDARPAQSAEITELVQEIRTLEPSGETSRLGTAVRRVLDDLRGSAPAAMVLLTDGINTDGPSLTDAATYARRKGVPLFTVALGEDHPVKDLKLSDLLVEEVAFVGDVIYFEAKLTGTGFHNRPIRVVLRREDQLDVLAEVKMTAAADGQTQPVRIAHRPTEEGEFRYTVEVEPLEGEVDLENNRQERTVRVRTEQIRVLLVQAYPSYEFRYLETMLQRDSTIELSTVLQNADPEHAEQDEQALKGFPVRRDELFEYDVVILGDVDPQLLTDSMMQNLVEFVDQPVKGGALVFIAGPEYMPLGYLDTPLEKLMPINLAKARAPDPNLPITEGFVIQPTELGLARPQMQLGDNPTDSETIWKQLPSVYWMLEAPVVKPSAHVLAEHPSRFGNDRRRLPVLLTQYVGAGKVLFHTTDETWRWRHRVGDTFFARYWIQSIRYLCRSKLSDGEQGVVLSTDQREYRRGESVRLRVRFADERLAPESDDGVTIVLEHKDHKTRRIRLHRSSAARGVFEGQLSRPTIGAYHAWMAVRTPKGRAPAVDFSVVAPPGEFERVETDTAELKRVVEKTKGRFYTPANAARLVDHLPDGRQVPIESLPPKPLWNTWPVLLIFLLLLITEWILRKVGGMV